MERGSKGPADEAAALRGALLVSAIRLVTREQLGKVRLAVARHGTQHEKELLVVAERQLQACGTNPRCYLDELTKPENQPFEHVFAGVKAAHMAVIFGSERTAEEFVDRLASIDSNALRYAAAQALDALLPQGSREIAKRLDIIITANEATGDRNRMVGDMPLKQVMYRLETRAD